MSSPVFFVHGSTVHLSTVDISGRRRREVDQSGPTCSCYCSCLSTYVFSSLLRPRVHRPLKHGGHQWTKKTRSGPKWTHMFLLLLVLVHLCLLPSSSSTGPPST